MAFNTALSNNLSKCGANPAPVTSRYFSTPPQNAAATCHSKGVGSAVWSEAPEHAKKAGEQHLPRDGAFRNFYNAFMQSFQRLYVAKPILIQEYVAHDPWKVLVAVTLLNKTAGKHAVPVFQSLIAEWPTAKALAQAPPAAILDRIEHLGLGVIRTQRLIKLSQDYLDDPPVPGRLRPSRCYIYICAHDPSTDMDDAGAPTRTSRVRQRYPPTVVSHLPGCGAYALDSYRIFCGHADEWQVVRPTDKELIKYLKWRWAVEKLRQWDSVLGPGAPLCLNYIRDLAAQLEEMNAKMVS
ncbi:hypothetical protein WOLCODRAFT_140960 [Wolfiporia cocos MD-104 SS10]|uniref:DNA glycosylase n=1 Tax=Wolfiporia cocos (strain MD-104) TaxID=742152 RepID=A0A2H3J7J6_WOLCO|nr:hypothetical protein WOLCODRAFT_140960 [Wolfiporia cocos MD-104 SS10]